MIRERKLCMVTETKIGYGTCPLCKRFRSLVHHHWFEDGVKKEALVCRGCNLELGVGVFSSNGYNDIPWNVQLNLITKRGYKNCECHKCGYSWHSKVEHPRECPSCKSPRWDEPYARYLDGKYIYAKAEVGKRVVRV